MFWCKTTGGKNDLFKFYLYFQKLKIQHVKIENDIELAMCWQHDHVNQINQLLKLHKILTSVHSA